MKQQFHRWDYLFYKDSLVGEWYKAEVVRVTNAKGHLYYVLRDLDTNEIIHRVPPDEVKPIPGFLTITTSNSCL